MKTFSITDVGMVRQVNQDYVYTTDNPIGPLPNLFVVADGMGGHKAGDYASKYTVEVMKKELAQSEEKDVEKGITQLTKDHSLVEEMVRLGGIKPEEAKHHPDKNIITRAIGAKNNVDVDFYEHRLKRGDIILMCTDGLSNMVEDEELFHIVQGGRDIVEAGTALVDAAKENGGTDNIGVVLMEPFTDEVSIC